MAQARRQNKRQGGSGGGLPGWAMLTIGLIIGLFVAFLIYLDDMDQPPNAAVQSQDSDSDSDAQTSASDSGEGEKDGPRFEFYSILPELEVVVPDFGGKSDDTQGDGSDAGTSDPAPAEVTDGGRYYLQAGSFREAKQADRMKAEIALIGLDVSIQEVQINGDPWHRVRVGPYTSTAKLQAAQRRLRENDIEYLVMREKTSDG